MNNLRHSAPGDWVSLMDFASKKSISLSTLRRHIKANKITYKIENGRYLLWDEEIEESHSTNNESQTDMKNVQAALQKAQEEIAELKTLIAFYEESTSPQKSHE
jgi:chromosome segregation ATPase